MSKETWKTINNPDVTEAFDPDKEPKLLAHVKNELEGDAFAMLDKALYEDICEVLEIMQKDDSLRNKHNLQHVQCSARSN